MSLSTSSDCHGSVASDLALLPLLLLMAMTAAASRPFRGFRCLPLLHREWQLCRTRHLLPALHSPTDQFPTVCRRPTIALYALSLCLTKSPSISLFLSVCVSLCLISIRLGRLDFYFRTCSCPCLSLSVSSLVSLPLLVVPLCADRAGDVKCK